MINLHSTQNLQSGRALVPMSGIGVHDRCSPRLSVLLAVHVANRCVGSSHAQAQAAQPTKKRNHERLPLTTHRKSRMFMFSTLLERSRIYLQSMLIGSRFPLVRRSSSSGGITTNGNDILSQTISITGQVQRICDVTLRWRSVSRSPTNPGPLNPDPQDPCAGFNPHSPAQHSKVAFPSRSHHITLRAPPSAMDP